MNRENPCQHSSTNYKWFLLDSVYMCGSAWRPMSSLVLKAAPYSGYKWRKVQGSLGEERL
jgi:hypothetical protein